ncbi:RNA polymerase sigma factor [Wenyingzhuangia aestuarii]|uniref:RNA polymerase sigma factor n=1 Tax=Wenyingzhuangia aestuarii TaxID=1647582 RepID=UPI00143AD7E1|nr:sigma-70 family RNA polymerase sigma factor [Wenyingzhuangia aestuarii]NJB82706.1 RNA polymerase sigma factor (sigma-70 family) [Wenyingzhuangia aestuarii]
MKNLSNLTEFEEVSFPKTKRKEIVYQVDNDIALWKEFQLGSEIAFAKIYKENVDKLYRYGLKVVYDKNLVKDAIQDLFIELWDRKEKLSEVNSIKSYLYTSLRRKLIKQQIKHKKTHNSNESVDTLKDELESIEFSLIEKQQLDVELKSLKKGLDNLKPKQREIVYLKFYARLSYEEIMDIMSLDKKQAYNLLSRTLKTLKDVLILLLILFKM